MRKPRPARPTRGYQEELGTVFLNLVYVPRDQSERREGIRIQPLPTDQECVESESVRVPGLRTISGKPVIELVRKEVDVERAPSLHQVLENILSERPFRGERPAAGRKICDWIFLSRQVM